MGKVDLNEGHGRFKGILFDYDKIREYSTDTGLYCLTDQQVAYLLSALEPATWKTRWYSNVDTPIDQDWLDKTFAELEVQLMTDRCQDILDALADLQTTVNIIENTTIVNLQIVNEATDNYQINYIINIINNPPPALPDKSFATKDGDTQTQRYARWCALVKSVARFIKSICYRMLAVNAPTNLTDLAAAWQDLATAGGIVLGILSTEPIGSFGETFNDILAAMTDPIAIGNVTCTMASFLMDKETTYANFLAACSAGLWSIGSNEFLLQEVIVGAETVDATFQYNYQGFLASLAGMFVQAMAEVPPPSSFDCDGCLYTPLLPTVADFTAGIFSGWVVQYGIIEPGNGIRSAHVFDEGSGNTYNVAWVGIDFPIAVAPTTLVLEYEITSDSEGLTVTQVDGINYTTIQLSGGLCTNLGVTGISLTRDGTVHTTTHGVGDHDICHIQLVQYSRNRYYIRKITIS